jgi:hypothetical protein
LAVPFIQLELRVSDSQEPNFAKKFHRQFLNIRNMVGDVVDSPPNSQWISSNDSFGVIEEVVTVLVEIGIVAAELVVATGDHFH